MEAKQPLAYEVLDAPVKNKDVDEYVKQRSSFRFLRYYKAVVVTLPFLGILIWATDDSHNFLGAMVWCLVFIVAWLIGRVTIQQLIIRQIRFERFAAANGFQFTEKLIPDERGSLFMIGRNRNAQRVISGTYHNHPFWLGMYYYTIQAGKHSKTLAHGVINITLPRALPRVIIDGRQNLVNLGMDVDKSQRLELEGDFNKYFSVYCPKDYERDVLYFLTPELMQQLIDMDDGFDVEIVGNELYFYSRGLIRPQQRQLKQFFALIDTVATEVVENGQRYQDHRIDKKLGTVASSGLEIKRSLWPTVVGTVLAIAYVVFSIIDAVMD